MNRKEHEEWRETVLQIILTALMESDELSDVLIFKGAWILNHHLETARHSRDIDSNLTRQFVFRHPDVDEQRVYLEGAIRTAISRHFDGQPIVRYRLTDVRTVYEAHPMGWSSFSVKLTIQDAEKSGVRGLPRLDIDIAAPEELSELSISNIALGSRLAQVYSLERIAGEKARAYLSTLPTYRKKFKKPGNDIRVKDLYDLVRISRAHPLSAAFWNRAGEEFERACRSRMVDCDGWSSFAENWSDVKTLFETDATLPKDVSFRDVEDLLPRIVSIWESQGVIPKRYYLPN